MTEPREWPPRIPLEVDGATEMGGAYIAGSARRRPVLEDPGPGPFVGFVLIYPEMLRTECSHLHRDRTAARECSDRIVSRLAASLERW